MMRKRLPYALSDWLKRAALACCVISAVLFFFCIVAALVSIGPFDCLLDALDPLRTVGAVFLWGFLSAMLRLVAAFLDDTEWEDC